MPSLTAQGTLLGLLLLLLLLGVRPTLALPNLNIRNWQTQDGLPSNKITAVAQTPDGYLWAASSEGLARFDGIHFVLFDSGNTAALRDSDITCLHAARDGALLIGHASGTITRLFQGRFETIPSRHDPEEGFTKFVCEDERGDLWTMTDTGVLCRQRDGLKIHSQSGLASRLVELTCSPEGHVWISNAGLLYELQEASLRPIGKPPLSEGYVQGICSRRQGGLWVVFANRLCCYDKGLWTSAPTPGIFSSTPLHAFIETSDGRLVAGTSDHGAFFTRAELPDQGTQLWRDTGFPADWVLSLCEDREGNVWLGTGNAGLFLVRPSPVSTPVPEDHWQDRALLTVASAHDGGLWVGTEGAGLYHLKGNSSEHYAKEAGLRVPYVWSILEDKDENLWLGTWGGGVFTGKRDALHLAPGLETLGGPVAALVSSSQGGIWVGAAQGLLHYRDGRATAITPAHGKGPKNICALIDDEHGTVWVGSRSDGLWVLHPDIPDSYTRIEGLGSDQVQCLYLDAWGSLWIGTMGAGLKRFRQGEVVSIGPLQGIDSTTLCHLGEDLNGVLWMSSNAGILHAPLEQLNRCADGLRPRVECRNLGIGDGLPTLNASGGAQPSGCLLADGRLAFATSRGLVLLDPSRLNSNSVPPPVIIERFLLDGTALALGTGTPLQVPPGEHRLELYYTGLSFSAPEKVRFRHRLVGLDATWNEVGQRRSAEYNYLPPGSYRFEVLACNNDGVWNTLGDSLGFVILPHFYQTVWFRALTLLSLLSASAALAWYITRRNERLKLQRLQQQRAIELERTRIANDMHDDLGSQLTRITMLSEGARASLQDASRTAAGLTQIYDTARGMTRSMDEIVWAVNPKHDRLESLVNYLEKYATDFLASAGIRCRLDLPMEFPSWTPGSELRHNLFLAFKEVLNNAAKHSGASLVEISVEITSTEFRLGIRDDGRGFCPAPAPGALPVSPPPSKGRLASGNGLTNLHARMKHLGGRCEIDGKPGTGTHILLVAPVSSPHASPRQARP